MIHSVTKNRQPTETLRAMVARAFGPDQVLDDGFEELGLGWFNVAYRVRLASGASVVLKIAPPAGVEVLTYERGMLRTEVAALRLVAERTSVPVPRVLAIDESRDLCDADYFFMEFVEGETLSTLPAAERPALQGALGALNRQLNEVSGSGFGPLLAPSSQSWRDVFTGMVHDVLADGERRSVDIGVDYATIRRLIAEHASSLDEVTEPRFVEWDLWDGNALVRDGSIVGIIDHERAFWGDPLMESGFAALVLPGTLGDASSFANGYGIGPLTSTQLTRRRLYTLHLLLVMTIETVYRGHESPAQYEFSRAALAELVETFSP